MDENYDELEKRLKEIIENLKTEKNDINKLIELYKEGQNIIAKMESLLKKLKDEVSEDLKQSE